MSAARDDGGPAFPMQDQQAIHAFAAAAVLGIEGADERDAVYTRARAAAIGGMSLRDHFAGMAMQGMIAAGGGGWQGWDGYSDRAEFCYAQADAMLEARKS